MASPLNHKIMLLLVVNGFLFLTTHAAPTPLQEVCNKAVNIGFCLNVFGSDPATRTASLPELGQLAIAKAKDKAAETREESKTGLFFATDPRIRDALTACVDEYDRALATLQIARYDLKRARYADLYRRASDAARRAITCQQGFLDKSLPSPLTIPNLQLRDYCNIIEVIADSSQ